MEFRTLKSEELEQWYDHCLYVFNEGKYDEKFRQYFKNHWMNDPWKDLSSIFVAVDEGIIASTIRIFHRRIYLNGQTVKMGGIGEVSTKPEYQCRGLSTELFSLAVKRMQELDIKVSMLSAAFEKIGYYNKLGWESVKRSFNVSSITAEDKFQYNIRPVNFKTDIPEIKSIYEAYSKQFNGTIVRHDEDYWTNWVKTEAKNIYVAEDSNKVIAYIDFDIIDKAIRVREFGEMNIKNNLFSSIIKKLAAICNYDTCKVSYSSSIPSDLTIDETLEDINEMIRLMNPFKLNNIIIENTKQLVKAFGDITYWDTDSF